MVAFFKEFKTIIGMLIGNFLKDNIMLHAAALAFYTIFSLAPLLLIIIALAGFFFGEQAAQGQLVEYMEQLMGTEMAEEIESLVASAYQPRSGLIATGITIGTILFASTTVIAHLKDSLNQIWHITARSGQGLKRFFIDRALALCLILIFTAFIISSIVMDALLSYLEPTLDPIMPGGVQFWSILNTALMFLVTTTLFAIVYKLLPDIRINWSDVWVGALVTALCFLLGSYLVTLYLTGGILSTAYGAAGTFVIFLIWVYYNTVMVYLGAEFTKIYTDRYGSKIKPAGHAMFYPGYMDQDATEGNSSYQE